MSLEYLRVPECKEVFKKKMRVHQKVTGAKLKELPTSEVEQSEPQNHHSTEL